MSLIEDLRDRLGLAMKAGDRVAVSTIRLVLSAVRNAEIDAGHQLSDAEAVEVIQREAKRRRESIEAYLKADRADLVSQERAELDVLQQYLPQQMDESQTEAAVTQIVAEVGASGPRDKGKVMGLLMQRHRAEVDGKLANRVVDRVLSSEGA